MHRHRIRAFIAGAGGGETDVPVTIFAAGQYVRYISGVGLMTTSLGPGTTVVNAITTWGDTTGTQLLLTPVLLDNAGNMTQLVTLDGQDAPRITATLASASPTTGKLTKWASSAAPWKLDATQTLQVVNADGIDGLYGVGVINGRDPSKWVDGPTPAAATDNALARWDTTSGRLLQNSVTTLSDSGAMDSVATLNTVDVTALSSNQRWLYGPKTTTINAIVAWNSTAGGLVREIPITYVPETNTFASASVNAVFLTVNGVDPATWVRGPASSTVNQLASYADSTGKVIKASPVTADSSGNIGSVNSLTLTGTASISSVSAINGRDPARWLQGPTSSTNNGIPRFIGTTGALATDSVVTIDSVGGMAGVTSLNGLSIPTNNWVRGPNFGTTSSTLARWNSTDGRVITDSGVTLDGSGNLTGLGTLNGYILNDFAKGVVTFFGGSTGFSPGYGLPKRGSSYRVGFVAFVPVTFGDTTGTVSLSMSSDDNNGTWQVHMPNASAALGLGSGGTWPNPGTFVNASFLFAATCVVPSGSGIYNLNLNISSSGSMTINTGWQMWVYS